MQDCFTESGTAQRRLTQCCRLELHAFPRAADLTSVVTPDSRWEYPAAGLTLVRGGIHLWRAWLDEPVADLDPFSAMLSADERERADRYRFEKHRQRFILRRALLRVILGRYLDTAPARLRFSLGPFGKPALESPRDDALQFNLSHADGLALYAVTRDGAVGVDVERVRVISEAEQIAALFFTPQELAEWLSQPSHQRPESFLRRWSRTEAWLKMKGRGIADGLETIQSRLESAPPHGELGPRRIADAPAESILYDLTPAPGYVAALALAAAGVVRE